MSRQAPSSTAVLVVGDTIRCPELRHEVPITLIDPIVYLEAADRRHVVCRTVDAPLLGELPDLHVRTYDDFGDDLVRSDRTRQEMLVQVVGRACASLEVESVTVPGGFPLGVARHLEQLGIMVSADQQLFDERRQVKTAGEIAGIARALAGVEAALFAIRARLREDVPVSSEELRAIVVRELSELGLRPHEIVIVSHGWQTAIGHHPGAGEIGEGEPIIADLICSDPSSGCWADITRTFCVGEPGAELLEYHRLSREALTIATGLIRAGVPASEPADAVNDHFERAGYATKRSRAAGGPMTGFFHALGHSVGLEVHEGIRLDTSAPGVLAAGDVVAVEPGVYRPGFGGARLEDMLLVEEGGCRLLSPFDYALVP